jgi:glycosyltransferase involved in cell wall biosynthesis
LNILALNSSSDFYGSSKIFFESINTFRKCNLNPIVILPHFGPLVAELEKDGFTVHVENLGILRRKYVNPIGLANRISKNLKAYQFLNKLHRQYQFELVYSNTLAVVVGAYWAKRKQIPHCWHIHEILPGPAPLVKWLSYLLDQTTPAPIAVSQAVGNHWGSMLKKSEIEVIPNGIPYGEFLEAKGELKKELGLSQETLLIGMVGRINPGKGQLFFLEIAQNLLKTHSNLHFVLVGDPFPGYEPILEEIKEEIRNKSLETRVSYLGFRKDIPELMDSLDIFVLPSVLPDSFPTVILEAMAASKPVLATRSGGASEMVVEGETGFLIPIGEVESGATALDQLIKNKKLRIEMGQAGRARVLREFSLQAFEEKIKNHLWQHLKKI